MATAPTQSPQQTIPRADHPIGEVRNFKDVYPTFEFFQFLTRLVASIDPTLREVTALRAQLTALQAEVTTLRQKP